MPDEEQKYKPIQVLIAEDDLDDQFIFETAFREIEPAAVLHFFFTTQELIQYMVKMGIQNDPETFPDLIIGDMKLPFFELKDIAEIRTYKQFEKIPVYVFAEGYTDVTRTNALALGASGFYNKPNSLHTLKDMVQEIVSKKNVSPETEKTDLSKLGNESLEHTLQAEEHEEEE